MKRLLLAGVLFLLLFPANRASANSDDEVNAALAASLKWVGLIDTGHYDESYQFGGDAFRDKVQPDRWTLILKTLRAPLGEVASRKQTSHIFKPNGYEGASGEFIVITYDTSFKNLPDALEVVVLRREGGRWRGAGYNAGGKPSDTAAAPAPSSSTTEVNTQMHVKPNPQ